MAEQFESQNNSSSAEATGLTGFSGEACNMLGAAVRNFLENGAAHDELARVTARLCREAHARGLSADETLAEIRTTLGGVLAACTMTSSDKAALVALAIDECVHAFYHNHR